jgi:hypothetical protein
VHEGSIQFIVLVFSRLVETIADANALAGIVEVIDSLQLVADPASGSGTLKRLLRARTRSRMPIGRAGDTVSDTVNHRDGASRPAA